MPINKIEDEYVEYTPMASSIDSFNSKVQYMEENISFIKKISQKDLMDIAFKQMGLVEIISNILRYIMLMLLTLMLLNLGYITSVYTTISLESIILHGCEAIVYGAILVVIYILQKDLNS